jgi:tetratricopeptide (TPR) repeat protein
MKRPDKLLLFVFFIAFTSSLFAQNNNQASDLIKQGVELHNQGKYDAAIDKYNEVLKSDPENGYANYEIAFSLYAAKKGSEAIPHLEKAVNPGNVALSVAAYALIGSIYDEGHQPQKAIEAYDQAIKINPDYPQIFYNKGIAYFRNQQYAEAETTAIEAIKHNPKNASSQRLYALVTFHQNKRVNALLAFCSFILLEPNTPRSTEAYNNIQHILQGGVLKDNNGNTSIPVSAKDGQETSTLNMSISLIALSAKTKNLTGMDLLEYQLKNIFTMAGQLAEKKTDKSFFDKFFVDYFYKLAQSDNMDAFTHTVALTVNKDESAKWGKENTQKTNALAQWLQSTERSF